MSDSESDEDFHRRVSAGTDSSADELDNRFRQRLCQLVEQQMNRRYRRREDPEDVVQSVFRTFFRRAAEGEFQIQHAGGLWRLLQSITRRKILKHVEHINAKKRDPGKEHYPTGDELPALPADSGEAHLLGEALEAALAGLQAPEPEVMRLQLHGYTIAEIVDTVLSNLESPYPEILQLRLQGNTETEISERLGCGREAIRYKLRRICARLNKVLGGEAEI